MSTTIIIPGWPSTDRVPGGYGEVVYGAGQQSAASIPKKLLCVGLKGTTGNIALDTEARQILQVADAEAAGGNGGEATCMAYDALQIPGVVLYMACPTGAGGTAATAVIRIKTDGTPWSTSGSWLGRFAGTNGTSSTAVTVPIAATDTATTLGVAIAAAINSNFRLPYTATASSGLVTLTCNSAGPRGNQHIFFQDTSQLPTHCISLVGGAEKTITSTSGANPDSILATGHGLVTGDYVTIYGETVDLAANGTWLATVTDANDFTIPVAGTAAGGATGFAYGPQVLGGGARFVGGTTVESYTNLLLAIKSQTFDRIAIAANDATSLAAWKSQVDSQATVLNGILQHAVTAQNTTLTNATSLAQTTLNDQRFQVMWHQNSETHPSRISASFAAYRAVSESQDPGAAAIYAGWASPTIQPQSQQGDWANHATQVAALNSGVTPVTTAGDGSARVIRSIVSHSLNGSNPDYSTFDTCDATVPDFVLKDIQLYDVTVTFKNNTRVADDPPSPSPLLVAGVLTPSQRNASIIGKLRDYEAGKNLPAPLITNVSGNLPVSGFDPVAKRIVSAVNVAVMPPNLQLGTSVRQQATAG